VGFIIEVVADWQKSVFSAQKTGKWIDVGLWRYSRHPNYFGEIVLWVGIFTSSVSVLKGSQWVTVLSPMFVIWMLTKLSGIPMLEKRSDEKWGNDVEYQRYKASTSALIPFFRKTINEDDYQGLK